MSVLTARPAIRWAVPLAVVAVVLTGGVAGRMLTADADPALPERSAAELLVDLQTSSVTGLSGTVVQRAALGLPNLPVSLGGQGSAEFSALVTGTHTLRVWYAGEDRQRIALLGTLGESDLVHNGEDVWTWYSQNNEVKHIRLPEDDEVSEQPQPTDVPMTPQEAADAALAAIDPSTRVSTDGTAVVAGRSAYELVLQPRDERSLVGQVRIAIDAEQQVPLRVRVFAAEATAPAFEIGFTQISFETPGDEHFEFRPPPGAEVTEINPETDVEGPFEGTEAPEPTVLGSGWAAVFVTEAPDLTDSAEEMSAFEGFAQSLPRVSGEWGSGWLLKSALMSALLTDDGQLLIGAVTPERLFDLAAG